MRLPLRSLVDGHLPPHRTAAIIGLFTACVFLPTVRYDFVSWDDNHYVYRNSTVLEGLTPQGIRRALTEIQFFNWAPLTTLSYQADKSLFGLKPWGFHLTNVLLHAGTTAGLYLALVRMTGANAACAAAAVLYGIHPQRVESVAWISDRKDLLGGLFLVVAIIAYERYCRSPSWAGSWAVAAAMAASLLAKATTIVLPLLLLLCDMWPLCRSSWLSGGMQGRPKGSYQYPQRSAAELMVEKLPLFGLAAVFALITMRTHVLDIAHAVEATSLERLGNAWNNVAWYVEKAVVPLGLHPMQRWEAADRTRGVAAAVAAIAFGAAALACRGQVRHAPAAAPFTWGCAWFLAASSPILGLTGQVGVSPHADRFMYVPHMGLAVAAVWTLSAAWSRLRQAVVARWRPALGYAACAAVGAGLVVATERQLASWKNTESLWKAVLRVDPDNSMALTKEGSQKLSDGDYAAAEAVLDRVIRDGAGEYAPAIAALAEVYAKTGRRQEALAQRDWVARIDRTGISLGYLDRLPEFQEWNRLRTTASTTQVAVAATNPVAMARFREGMAAVKRRDFGVALRSFQAATVEDPRYAAAHNNLGMAAIEIGDLATAEKAFRRAVELAPAQPDYAVNLVRLLVLGSRCHEALPLCEAAGRLAPHDPEIRRLLLEIHRQIGK